MKIAALTNTALDPTLGSGKTVIAWTEGLRRLGHEVDVFAPDSYYRPWAGEAAKRLKMRLDPLKLETRLRTSGYDLIEFYGAEFGLLVRRLARQPLDQRPLLIAHTNGLELQGEAAFARNSRSNSGYMRRIAANALRPWIRWVDVQAFAKADAFAAICQADMDYLVARNIQPRDRCAVVEPGIDDPFLLASWETPKKHRFVCLGSWTERKDPETLMAVAARVMEQDSEVEFHVLGAWGARQTILEHLPHKVHSRTVIHPRLRQEEMVEILSQSKVFVFPSLYEGFGMATTEAMACGCAVVVTPTGFGAGIRHGIDGLVCPFGDREALAAATLRLLQDAPFRDSLARAGHQRVAGFRWGSQSSKLESIYRRWRMTMTKNRG